MIVVILHKKQSCWHQAEVRERTEKTRVMSEQVDMPVHVKHLRLRTSMT